MRYQIYKVRNGCWRLEWENGTFSEHSDKAGAERMLLQLAHKADPSKEEPLN